MANKNSQTTVNVRMPKTKNVLLCGESGKIRNTISGILQDEAHFEKVSSIEPTGIKQAREADLLIVLLVESKITEDFFEDMKSLNCKKIAVHTFDPKIVRDSYLAKGFDEYVSVFDLLEDLSPIISGLLYEE